MYLQCNQQRTSKDLILLRAYAQSRRGSKLDENQPPLRRPEARCKPEVFTELRHDTCMFSAMIQKAGTFQYIYGDNALECAGERTSGRL
jgi:hypothetical protein